MTMFVSSTQSMTNRPLIHAPYSYAVLVLARPKPESVYDVLRPRRVLADFPPTLVNNASAPLPFHRNPYVGHVMV